MINQLTNKIIMSHVEKGGYIRFLDSENVKKELRGMYISQITEMEDEGKKTLVGIVEGQGPHIIQPSIMHLVPNVTTVWVNLYSDGTADHWLSEIEAKNQAYWAVNIRVKKLITDTFQLNVEINP